MGENGVALLNLPYKKIVGAEKEGDSECPRSQLDYVHRVTGERFPLRCKVNTCQFCGPRNAGLIATAQARSEPRRMFLITDLPLDWQKIRHVMNQIREALADAGIRGEWAYSVEPNPSGNGKAHVHGLHHGDFIPQKLFSQIAKRNGAGSIVMIQEIRDLSSAARYGVKAAGAAFYGVKASKETYGAFKAFLDVNGKRIEHHSRGFYRLPSGKVVTQAEAVRAVISDRHPEDELKESENLWMVVSKGTSLELARRARMRALGTRFVKMPL
jgi:hypothetical protein